MNIAVFSDIHGNYQALESIINDIKKRNIEKIIFLGDAIALGPDSNKCLELLFNNKVEFILGNHELYFLDGCSIDKDMTSDEVRHHEWVTSTIEQKYIKLLKKCKMKITYSYFNKEFTFIHYFLNEQEKYPFQHLSILKDDRYKQIFNEIDSNYTFYGHNHMESKQIVNNKKYYGIGSSGCLSKDYTYYYLIQIDKDKTNINKINIRYNRDEFINRINSIDYPEKKKVSKIFFGIK